MRARKGPVVIRFTPNGRRSVIINKIRYRCEFVDDPQIEFKPKRQFQNLRPTTEEKTEWQDGTFPGMNVPGDEAGTVVEKTRIDDDFREFCDHGSHWASVGCGICRHEHRQQIKAELERRTKIEEVSQHVDELNRLKARIATRAVDDPEFADADVIEYEKLRIAELAKLINKKSVKSYMKPRIH